MVGTRYVPIDTERAVCLCNGDPFGHRRCVEWTCTILTGTALLIPVTAALTAVPEDGRMPAEAQALLDSVIDVVATRACMKNVELIRSGATSGDLE